MTPVIIAIVAAVAGLIIAGVIGVVSGEIGFRREREQERREALTAVVLVTAAILLTHLRRHR